MLITGTYDPNNYRTIRAQQQWDICRLRDKEMNTCIRPRTETGERPTSSVESRLRYTDYDERNNFRKPGARSRLYSSIL